jgi:hypothetical protein
LQEHFSNALPGPMSRARSMRLKTCHYLSNLNLYRRTLYRRTLCRCCCRCRCFRYRSRQLPILQLRILRKNTLIACYYLNLWSQCFLCKKTLIACCYLNLWSHCFAVVRARVHVLARQRQTSAYSRSSHYGRVTTRAISPSRVHNTQIPEHFHGAGLCLRRPRGLCLSSLSLKPG